MPKQHRLVGKVITGYDIPKDRQSITFDGPEPVTLTVSADCCSYTWIESLDNPAALMGRVLSVEDRDMPDLGSVDGEHHKGPDVVSYYGMMIVTENGHCLIDYRNDSNGYYGGNLD